MDLAVAVVAEVVAAEAATEAVEMATMDLVMMVSLNHYFGVSGLVYSEHFFIKVHACPGNVDLQVLSCICYRIGTHSQ